MKSVETARTAIRRTDFSRPVRESIESGLLTRDRSFFDFGCGHGDDIARLEADGFQASGWDPHHRPDVPKQASDIVNLGFVINVIESESLRAQILKSAWNLSRFALVVAARMVYDRKSGRSAGDDTEVRTSWGTFQKYYAQSELREWLESVLEVEPVSLSPGVMALFRDDEDRYEFLSMQSRYRIRVVKPRQCDLLFDAHRDLLTWLCDFIEARGRLPVVSEADEARALSSVFGSPKKAFLVVRRVAGEQRWTDAVERRRGELRIHFALERFGGRPRMSKLPASIQRDVRALFGSYKQLCCDADQLLMTAGNLDAVSKAMETAVAGKLTQSAFYVHESVLGRLPPILRVYEGCARRYYGRVADANIIKLNRLKPKVSYLEYPDFDTDAHPALARSHTVSLRRLDVRVRDFRYSHNPPILHRKECFLHEDDDRYPKFQRLTRAEERAGLLEAAGDIGTRNGWEAVLQAKGMLVRGHRLHVSNTESREDA